MDDNELIYRALNNWANYIETGNVSMGINDAHNINNSMRPNDPGRIKLKPLSPEQTEMIARMRILSLKHMGKQSSSITEPGRASTGRSPFRK